MIELQDIVLDGVHGKLAYFDENFEMTDEEHAVLAKIVFDDGTGIFYSVSPGSPEQTES